VQQRAARTLGSDRSLVRTRLAGLTPGSPHHPPWAEAQMRYGATNTLFLFASQNTNIVTICYPTCLLLVNSKLSRILAKCPRSLLSSPHSSQTTTTGLSLSERKVSPSLITIPILRQPWPMLRPLVTLPPPPPTSKQAAPSQSANSRTTQPSTSPKPA